MTLVRRTMSRAPEAKAKEKAKTPAEPADDNDDDQSDDEPAPEAKAKAKAPAKPTDYAMKAARLHHASLPEHTLTAHCARPPCALSRRSSVCRRRRTSGTRWTTRRPTTSLP